MATAMLLRRQFTPTSLPSRRAFAALTSLLHTLSPSISTIQNGAFSASGEPESAPISLLEGARGMHARSGRVEFRASFASQAAGFAMADYSDQEKTRVGDGGLDIASLNVHEGIVVSLSKKGITKLFPIQKSMGFRNILR